MIPGFVGEVRKRGAEDCSECTGSLLRERSVSEEITFSGGLKSATKGSKDLLVSPRRRAGSEEVS